MNRAARSGGDGFGVAMWRSSAALLVWALHLGLVYTVTALVCAGRLGERGPFGVPVVPVTIAAATAAALAVIVVRVLRWRTAAHEPGERFFLLLGLSAAALSACAVLWTAITVLIVPPCSVEGRAEPTGALAHPTTSVARAVMLDRHLEPAGALGDFCAQVTALVALEAQIDTCGADAHAA